MGDHVSPLTISEAAARLKLSPSTVKRMLREGALTPHRYPGVRRTFVLAAEVEALLAPDTSVRAQVPSTRPPSVRERVDAGRKPFTQKVLEMNEREARERGR